MSTFLHIERYGDKNKSPLLLLHGFAGSSRYWHPYVNKLIHNFQLIIPDLPGHGNSEFRGNDFRFEAAVDQILDELLCIENRPMGIIGYSMGSRFGFYFLSQRPERFHRAFFMSGTTGIIDEDERKKRLSEDYQLAEHIQKNGLEWFQTYWMNLPIFSTRTSKEVLDRLHAIWKTQDASQLSIALKVLSVGNQNNLLPRLQNNLVPIFYCAGELDKKFSSIGDLIAKAVPNVHFSIVENCGHDIASEQPEWFEKQVNRLFLENLP